MNEIKGKLYLIDIQNDFIKEVTPIELIDGNYQLKLFIDVIDNNGNIFLLYPKHCLKSVDEQIKKQVKKLK